MLTLSAKPKDPALARRQGGITRTSITRLEERIIRVEDKDTLGDSNHSSVRRLIKRLETLDAEFKQYHFLLTEGMDEGEGKLEEDQIILDEHDDLPTSRTDSCG